MDLAKEQYSIKTDPALALDWWVLSYFKILPTDPRFEMLSEEQKVLMYYLWKNTPDVHFLKKGMDMHEAYKPPPLNDNAKATLDDWFKDDPKGLESLMEALDAS